MKNRCCIIILAAGSSSRIGSPKQLLSFNESTLLGYTIEQAKLARHPLLIILGAYADEIKKEIKQEDLHIIENIEWRKGMASSIRCGVNAMLSKFPPCDAVIFLTCDQPYVDTALINKLISVHKHTRKSIVATDYGEAIGPPVLFHKKLFPELLKLEGDTGARMIVDEYKSERTTVYFPTGIVDIDTMADYEYFKKDKR